MPKRSIEIDTETGRRAPAGPVHKATAIKVRPGRTPVISRDDVAAPVVKQIGVTPIAVATAARVPEVFVPVAATAPAVMGVPAPPTPPSYYVPPPPAAPPAISVVSPSPSAAVVPAPSTPAIFVPEPTGSSTFESMATGGDAVTIEPVSASELEASAKKGRSGLLLAAGGAAGGFFVGGPIGAAVGGVLGWLAGR